MEWLLQWSWKVMEDMKGRKYQKVDFPISQRILFFAIVQISALMNWKTNQYIPMHSKPIRGMAFNGRNDGHLLTGAMDKMKITSLTSSTVVQT